MNDKKIHYFKLHIELARKYMLSPKQIMRLRQQFIELKLSREEILVRGHNKVLRNLRAAKSMNKKGFVKEESKICFSNTIYNMHDLNALNTFVAGCSKAQWDDITKLTKFDKKGGADGTG